MNRMDELNALMNEMVDIPESLDINKIKKVTKKKVLKHRIGQTTKGVSLFIIAFMAVLTVGVNTSTVFAKTVKEIPVISELAKIVSFNKGIEDAVVAEYGTPIGQKVSGKLGTVEIAYVMADDRSLVMFVKAYNDGKKTQGTIEPYEVIDTDTNEVLSSSYNIPELATDGKYTAIVYNWDKYRENISVDLKYEIYDDDNTSISDSETYSFNFNVGEKFEPKVYNVDKDYEIANGKYHIGKVKVFPMSTEIEVHFLNADEVETTDMLFELKDSFGLVRSKGEGLSAKYVNDDTYFAYVESGYFKYQGDLELKLVSASTISKDRKEVRLNLDTLEFTDKYGKVDEIYNVKKEKVTNSENEEVSEIDFSLKWDKDASSSVFWIKDNDGEYYAMTPVSFSNEGDILNSCIELNDQYINSNNEIVLERLFAENYEEANIKIKISN